MSEPVQSRPQLTTDEMQQLKWLLGGGLALLSLWTVFYMDIDAWWLMAITTVAAVVCMWKPTLPARLPARTHTFAFPVIVAIFLVDLWLTAELLPSMVRLDMLLLLYRCVTYRARRDDLQIIVLGLFLIVVAGVLSVSLVFAAQLLVYTACALAFLLTITLSDATFDRPDAAAVAPRSGPPPAWAVHADWRRLRRRLREVADWRVLALGGVLFVGVVAVSAVLFMAIPRFQLENNLFLDRFITKKAKSGFSDSIKFGDVTEIQQDNSLALSVDVSDPKNVPVSPYWRMLVLDQYENGAFKLSPALRRIMFGRERTGTWMLGNATPKLGPEVIWTFYLESGVSRYLPLPGKFGRLQFGETQNFTSGGDLGVVALRDEPVTMVAYRVENLDTTGVIPDPSFARRWRERDAINPAAITRGTLQNRAAISDPERDQLAAILKGLFGAGGDQAAPLAERMPAADFAQKIGAWLRDRHAYSLTPVIPAGPGDPLVRWLTSREGGHCELFAGSFVMLARVAGYPARVITGFKGGTWNAYSNNFTVRNLDAHAWGEIFDTASGAWLRSDPLAAPGVQQASDQRGEAELASRADRSWTARLESLRVFWYRRIVSFDQQSQAETLKAVKEVTQNTGKRLREFLQHAAARARAWLGGPWDMRRLIPVFTGVLGIALLVWLWRNFGYRLWHFSFLHRGRRDDPVRHEASRWLVRLGQAPRSEQREADDVRPDLLRLRFGARTTWGEPERIFRRARRTLREERRVAVAARK